MNITQRDNTDAIVYHRDPTHGDVSGTPADNGRPLRILRIATDLYPEVTGGGAIHAHLLSKHQAALGHYVTVLTSNHGKTHRPRVEDRNGYTVIRDDEFFRLFDNSITPGTLESVRTRLDATDVIHAHSHLYFSTNITALGARYVDTPFVVTNHGLISQTAPRWLQSLFIPTVALFTFNTADRILCYTETDRERLRNWKVTKPISVITNGIDCTQFSPDDSVPTSQQLLFVGRLNHAKGLQFLIEAFNRLRAKWPGLQLKVIGEGSNRHKYENRCANLNITTDVSFLGEIPYEEMPKHYRQSQVFVLPSLNEGLPRTVLEALACEVPVVTSSLPQLKPVVEGAGFTVETESVSGLVEAIDRLLMDPTRRKRMGRTGRQRVVNEYSWTGTVEKTTATYFELIDD